MSLGHGASVVRNGLVFHYDTYNTEKSWKGAPATNLITQGNSNNISSYARAAGTSVTTDQIPMPREVLKYSGTKTLADIASNASAFWLAYTGGPALTQGQQVMISWYVYGVTSTSLNFGWGGAHQGNLSSFTVNLLTGAVTNLSLVSGETYAVSKEDGGSWRISCSTTMTNGTACYPQLNSGAGSFSACGLQFELGKVVSRYLIGTRSNTQALIDLTKNNTITANSLTYNNNGTFSFNSASSNYASINPVTLTNSSYTVEAFIKRDSINATHGILSDVQYSWWTFFVNSSNKLNMYHARNNVYAVNSIAGATSISTEWTYVAAVFDKNVGLSVYVNGQLDGSNTNTVVFDLSAGRGPQYIGLSKTDAAGVLSNPFNGSISNIKLYNRSLSSTEIKQNFEALRGRYGI